jgi:hypothetical protein
MKQLFALLLICTTCLSSEEFLPHAALPEFEESDSLFFYVSGGVNPLPTVSLGFRTLYNSLGSDLSISGSLFPIAACGKMGVFPIPGVLYKQLFFTGRGWQNLAPRTSAFYLGAQTGAYYVGDLALNMGGLIGWQFKGKNHSDFFELGINPVVYTNKKFDIMPLGSLTYAFMF